MKIYGNRLTDTLRKGVAGVYVVSGDEPLLVQEACDEIRKALAGKGFTERDLFHVDAGFDWSELMYAINSMSLFAEQKILEVRMTAKPDNAGRNALMDVVEQLNDDNVLLMVMPRVDANTQRAKWFKALDAAGVFVQIWPIDAKELPGWLKARFKREGLEASGEAITAMAERIEGNLLAAVQEIARLKLVARGNRVDLDQVIEGVADSARYDVFKLIDAALLGDTARVVRMTRSLEAEGVELLYLVNMLARELRSLETMAGQLAEGLPMREVLKKGRVWDKRTNAVSRCLDRHGVQSLRDLQVGVGGIDRVVKGINIGNAWRDFMTLVMELAGAKMPRLAIS